MANELTRVMLCWDIPLDKSRTHTITFADRDHQREYFESMVVSSEFITTNLSYQRQQRQIAFPAAYDAIASANYVCFQNAAYNNKWFYAFIDDIEYVNDGMSYIHFTIDPYQTYMFDFELGEGFVEREHVTNDVMGAHLLEEPVACGPYITSKASYVSLNNFWLVVGSTINLRNLDEAAPSGVYGNIYSGIGYYAFDANSAGTFYTLDTILEVLASRGQSEAIVCMYMVPKRVVSSSQNDNAELEHEVRGKENLPYTPGTTLDGYTPKNKKLLTYPYRSLMLTNHAGNTSTLRFEFFKNPFTPVLGLSGGIQPGSRVLLYPTDYEGVISNYDYSVNMGNYPQASWQSSVYANWLASATVRYGYEKERQIFKGNVGGITDLLGDTLHQGSKKKLGIGGAIGGAIGSTIRTLGNAYMDYHMIESKMAEEKEVHSIIPNTVQGTIGNDYTMVSLNQYGFGLLERTITADYAKSIDGFFEMYGYKVNTVKTPNIKSRPYWNYVKCSNIVIRGKIPYNYLQEIRDMFINGCTFWHTTDVGNYSLNNH